MADLLDKIEDASKFHLLLNNYEGPIDLLLNLARSQKVDLSDISISELADQYIQFINQYRNIHIEIAADYLVMAAWLTYLKSRLLLPKEEKTEEHTAEELEKALKYQLQRLEAFQNISKILYARPLINRDVFYGGSSKGLRIKYNINYTSNLFDLLKSYSQILKSKYHLGVYFRSHRPELNLNFHFLRILILLVTWRSYLEFAEFAVKMWFECECIFWSPDSSGDVAVVFRIC